MCHSDCPVMVIPSGAREALPIRAKKRPVFSKARGEGSPILNHLLAMKTIIEEGEPPVKSRASTPVGCEAAESSERALQIKTILVPLDFSRASIQALKYTIPLAKEFEATIHLVHVQPTDELTAISNAGGLMLNCADAIALMQDRLSEALRARPVLAGQLPCRFRTAL